MGETLFARRFIQRFRALRSVANIASVPSLSAENERVLVIEIVAATDSTSWLAPIYVGIFS